MVVTDGRERGPYTDRRRALAGVRVPAPKMRYSAETAPPTLGSALHGKVIQRSERRQTYSQWNVVQGFS